MKKKVNKALASQFPNIYRFITEEVLAKNFKKYMFRLLNQPKLKKPLAFLSIILMFLIIMILAFGIMLFSFKIYKSAVYYRQISLERQNLQSQVNFWQSIRQKYDGYADAYFRIAVLEYRLGNFNEALVYNQKTLFLDPNFKDAKKLEVLLNKK